MADANAPGMHVNLRTPTGTPAGTAQDPIVVAGLTDPSAGATQVRYAYDWTGVVTAAAVWTPASGKKFVITDLRLECSASCTVSIFDSSDDLTGRVVKGTYAQYGGETLHCRMPFVSLAANNVLKITTSAGSGFLTVWGYEV